MEAKRVFINNEKLTIVFLNQNQNKSLILISAYAFRLNFIMKHVKVFADNSDEELFCSIELIHLQMCALVSADRFTRLKCFFIKYGLFQVKDPYILPEALLYI
jgi:hypothetical protein